MKRDFLIRVEGLLIVGLIVLIMSGCDLIEGKPVAPLWVLAAPQSSTSIQVNWASVFNATSYDVYYEPSPSNMQKLATTAETSYTHENLSAETTYTYFIRAINSNGTGDFSRSSSAKTLKTSDPTGKTKDNAITITAEGVTGTLLPIGSSELWYTFNRNGNGTLYALDKGNAPTEYTADIVADIYDSSNKIVTINGVGEGINLGYSVWQSINQTWNGTYYVKVYLYSTSLLSGGTFKLSFN